MFYSYSLHVTANDEAKVGLATDFGSSFRTRNELIWMLKWSIISFNGISTVKWMTIEHMVVITYAAM